jgi:hypothetical protein
MRIGGIGTIFGAGLHNVEGANIMQAKDVMTSPVVSVEPNATILQAIRTMLQRRISGLPVIDKDGHLVRVVTEGDFFCRGRSPPAHANVRIMREMLPSRVALTERRHGHAPNSVRHQTTYRACGEKLPCHAAKNPLAQPGMSICPCDQQVGAFLLRERQ